MTPTETARILSLLKAAFPRQPIAAETASVYHEMLLEFDGAHALAASKRLIASSQYFPTVSEIRRAILDADMPTGGGAAAWAEVTRAFAAVGRYRTPTFADPLTEMTVAAMGWETLCSSTEPGVDRSQFMRIYDAYRERVSRDRNLASLPAPATSPRIGEARAVGALLAARARGADVG